MIKLILNIFNNKYVKAIIVLDITILLTMLLMLLLYVFPIISLVILFIVLFALIVQAYLCLVEYFND